MSQQRRRHTQKCATSSKLSTKFLLGGLESKRPADKILMKIENVKMGQNEKCYHG